MTTITILLAVALSGLIIIENTEKTRMKLRRRLEGKAFAFRLKVYVTLFVLTTVIVVILESFIAYLLSLLFGFEFTAENVLYIYTASLASVHIIERAAAWKKRRNIIRLVRELNSEKSAQ